MDVVSALQDQAEQTSRLVGSVRPDQLGLPTPCPGFDVRALVNHLCLVCEFCVRVAAGERADPDYETDFVGDDPSGAYAKWKYAMVQAVSAPGLAERTVHMSDLGEVPGDLVLAVAVMDSVVHRWDLARALGRDPEIAPEVASLVLELLTDRIPDEKRAPSPDTTTGSIPFGPEVYVPDDAPPLHKLVAFLGRMP